MISTRKPYASKRKKEVCSDWLGMLEPAEIKERWAKSGKDGFYSIERLWLARFCVFPEVRDMAQEELRVAEEKRQAQQRALTERKQVVTAERENELTRIRASITGLDAETHGTVRAAAERAGDLYMSQHIPRTLKQCIAIASSENLVAFGSVIAYLAGVGVRVIAAKCNSDDIWEETHDKAD